MNRFKPLNIGNLTASLPIIQGGMGVGISLSSLAGAVAKAGGVGIISTAQIGFRDPDFYKNSQEANLKAMETELKKAREIAPDGILGFNIMVATKNYVEYVKTAVKIGADIIISGAGLPVNLPEYVKGTATKIAPIVSTVKSAKVICKLWDRNYKTAPDLVVVEGPLAGGHLGFSREQLTELGADTDQVSKTYHKAEYEEEVKGIIALVPAICEFLSGDLLPLPFFPEKLRKFAELSPFGSLQNVPLRIFGGDIAGTHMICSIALQLFWCIVITAMGYSLMHRGMRRLCIAGG